MATIQFHAHLRKRVGEIIERETDQIVGGYSAYDVYREQVGYLKGLKEVLAIAEEIEKGMT